jgi:nitroreductase
MSTSVKIEEYRTLEFGADPLFLERWSPRAMNGEAIGRDELMRLFEAARWAPSAFNNQPWRFIYALRGSDHWPPFFDLLVEANRLWAVHAGALVVIVSKRSFDYNGKPSRTHSLDTGAAWGSLALQGSLSGLVVHGMQGFDYDRAAELLGIGDGFQVEAMAAIGRPGETAELPEELQEREIPSSRKEFSETVFEGKFNE